MQVCRWRICAKARRRPQILETRKRGDVARIVKCGIVKSDRTTYLLTSTQNLWPALKCGNVVNIWIVDRSAIQGCP